MVPWEEYRFFPCPLDFKCEEIQEAFWDNYLHYGEHDLVTIEWFDHLLKDKLEKEYWDDEYLSMFMTKYQLTDRPFYRM
jgi:hypothetical protein